MHNCDVAATCKLTAEDYASLDQAMTRFKLSTRAYHSILKVVRTIADLEGSEMIRASHLSEAVSYRTLDRLFAIEASSPSAINYPGLNPASKACLRGMKQECKGPQLRPR
jgi:hypothetical protein